MIEVLRRLRLLGTRHPAWREDFTVREGPLHIQSGWRVTAIDASGAEFGFGVGAGWPEEAQQMAVDLAALLSALHEPDRLVTLIEAICVVNVEAEPLLPRERWKVLRGLLIELEARARGVDLNEAWDAEVGAQ